MAKRKYYKGRRKKQGNKKYRSNYKKKRYRSNDYAIYGASSTIFYIVFMIITYQLGLNNPFYDSNPGLWWIGTYLFTELVEMFAYKSAYKIVGDYGIKGTGDIRAAIRSGEHWFARLVIYATILFITSFVLWIAYWISLLFY